MPGHPPLRRYRPGVRTIARRDPRFFLGCPEIHDYVASDIVVDFKAHETSTITYAITMSRVTYVHDYVNDSK